MWMGPIAFQYYGEAAIRYIQGEHAELDADIINCFAGRLNSALNVYPIHCRPIATRPQTNLPLHPRTLEKVRHLPAIYGDLRVSLCLAQD